MLSDNARGALWMSASMAGFVGHDTLMKSLADEIPLFQAIFLRGLIATALITAFAWYRGALKVRPHGRDARLIGWRMLAEIGATTLFLTALFNMALANAVAIIQAAPLAVTLAAALILGDPVGWRRYLAIVVGFVGVLFIVRPGTEDFNIFALAALGAVGFIVLRDLSTRTLSALVPSLLVTCATALSITAFAGIITAASIWQPVSPEFFLRLCCAALFLLVGYYAGIHAMRVGEIGFVSPFRYTNLIFALILGYVVFSDLPDAVAFFGAALVVAAGLFTLYRERKIATDHAADG